MNLLGSLIIGLKNTPNQSNMDFNTEHNESTNQMICIYSNEYKSITDKTTGDTIFYKNDEVFIEEKGVSVKRFCELQKLIWTKVSKLRIKS